VEVPKDQQVEGGLVLRESQLQGAFKNPGAFNGKPGANKPGANQPNQKKDTQDESANAKEGRTNYATPIKNELIGTDNDAQLKAALGFLQRNPGMTTGAATPQ